MLVGSIKYRIEVKADGVPVYENFEFEGVDSSSVLYGRLRTSSCRASDLMAGVEDADSLWERRFNVNMSSVKIETEIYKDSNGRKVKKPVNYDFFCKLGALIRYTKSKCAKKYADDYTGLKLASGEFIPEPETTYNIPLDDGTLLGTVRLRLGEIVSMHVTSPDFVIDIDEDVSKEMTVFSEIKNATPKGFKFDTETLGFYIAPQVVEAVPTNNGIYTSLEDIIKNRPDREFDWLLDNDYRIVSDGDLEEVCKYIMNHEGYVYYDTETTGLNINFKSRINQADQLVGVVLSVKYGESFFFPTQMKSIPNLCGGDHWYFMEHYMRPILEGKELVAHNMEFDWKVAYIYDINANIVHDTMALFKLTIGAEKENFPIGLKELTRQFLHRDSLELSDLVEADEWGESDIKFWDLPYESVRLYACADTDNTKGLLDYAMSQELLVKYNATRVYEIEIAFSYAVAYQEFYGHKIDVDNLDTLRNTITKGLEDNMAKLVDLVGYEFNPNSSPQLVKIMYEELGIPPQISRKTGNLTTDKETLKKLSEVTDIEGNVKYPFCKYLQKYREFEGVRKILDQFPDLSTEDGYLFSHVMQYGTTTGRVSINTPNYQSYNNPVKQYVVPRPGFYMTDSDYSSVEYRVLGSMSGNKMIMDGFVDPDFDYHAYQAARMYNVPYAAVTKTLRKAAKGINFGLPYGMGDESLGIRVFGEKSDENTRKAASLRAKYFEGQEDIKDFFEEARANGVNKGYTETYFGRRRYYHRNKFSINAIRRQAGNQVIQGCIRVGTLIHDSVKGTVKIEELAGYKAEVWNGTDWTTGDVLYSGKKRNCIVKFRGGYQFECSPEHKFLVRSHRGNEKFVACKDLIPLYDGDRVRKNAHRVVVSEDFCPSLNMFKSDKIYDSTTWNANNVYLEDIKDDFTRGVVLGRLSSDGSVDADSGRVIQIIAEHELDVYDYLIEAMSPLGCSYKVDDVRQDRNEALAHVWVYSKSLANEIKALDIRHQIHPKIWANTDMLRGFLCGLFDGDGGISGKTIAFVQGTQENFEPFVKEIQKALLFFGIRSRYRSYDDRFVLQIKTTDNERFLDVIGFINKDKQDKGRALECVEDEHVFGRCLMVESVEITDELVDMYDICNTDGGYYVANGLVTHNTAADIYKLAVGRLFKRICKEGWLGKVLLTGFIHDEVLCEVHNSIDPMVWLRVLREEFEVKIEGWCPLYMGFGFGMSWYEAKSVELPIKLQWELVDRYGTKGYPKWNGNGTELCAEVPDILRDFSIRDTAMQLIDEKNQNDVIKPTLNNEMFDVLAEDKSIYEKSIEKLLNDNADIVSQVGEQDYLKAHKDELLDDLGKAHITGLYMNGDYICTSFDKTKDTQQAITDFCMLHSINRSRINLLNIPDASTTGGDDANAEIEFDGYDTDDGESVFDKQRIMDTRVDTLGLYLDIPEKMIVLKMLPAQYMTFIKSKAHKGEGDYKIRFKDCETKRWFDTDFYIMSEDINTIQQLYIRYFNGLVVH